MQLMGAPASRVVRWVIPGVMVGLACAGGAGDEPPEPAIPVISAEFHTERDTVDNIDSPAIWHGPSDQHWLLATAKETDVIVVTDARDGLFLHRFGGEGAAPGQLDRPNGIAVMDDMLFVVERDNARVQVFTLPDFQTIGIYGAADLQLPYGIALQREGNGRYRTWITDNYEQADDVVPPDSMLGQRVREYTVLISDGALSAQLVRTFGATSGPGVLRVVESIAVDSANQRLLIAEEQERASMVKEYATDGSFTGRIIPDSFFPNQAEGIVLYDCGGTAGYWITTDQGKAVNTFHVFDRVSLDHLGSFRGERVLNTDGIALTQVGLPGYENGAFYAVHDDGNVAGFRWAAIAGALGLRTDCAGG